jgi:hypothetical protein
VGSSAGRAARAAGAACAASLALIASLAACGSVDQRPRVRQTLGRFAAATARKDYRTVCRELLAPAIVEQLTQLGLPCERALAEGLGSVRSPQLAVRSVRVDGARAQAQVHSSAANQPPSDDTIELVRARGAWRISSLGGASPGSTGPPGRSGRSRSPAGGKGGSR